MSEKRKSKTWKFCENTVKDMWWNKVLPTKEWWRDPLTSYEFDFCSDYVSIEKVKSQKVWSRSVDFSGDSEGKTWRGWIPPPPPPGWNRVKIKTKFHATSFCGIWFSTRGDLKDFASLLSLALLPPKTSYRNAFCDVAKNGDGSQSKHLHIFHEERCLETLRSRTSWETKIFSCDFQTV